jgi:hypothetical protein
MMLIIYNDKKKEDRACLFIDVAIPSERNVMQKEAENLSVKFS